MAVLETRVYAIVVWTTSLWLLLQVTVSFNLPAAFSVRKKKFDRQQVSLHLQNKATQGSKAEVLTNALLRLSYDGRHFTGWSSGNDPKEGRNTTTTVVPTEVFSTRSKHRRRRRGSYSARSGFVRSVQGELQYCLSKVYGNINPNRVVVEGCSRTDKGVHATGMMAHVYCLVEDALNNDDSTHESTIPGKRLPHPRNATDCTCFELIRMDLSKLAFTLNRMLPFDIRVTGIAPTPTTQQGIPPFHATLSAKTKTYEYTFSVGPRPDPTQRRSVWHVGTCVDLERIQQTCTVLEGSHDFDAFQGAPRGSDDKHKRMEQNTTCTLSDIAIQHQSTWLETNTYVVSITGDRFLYKMMRFLVGGIVAVGAGKMQVSEIQEALQTGDRQGLPILCAPADGLVLRHVDYDMPIDWQPISS